MKKIFVALFALLLLFTVSCTKDTPTEDEPPVLTDFERAEEYISQGKFEDAYTLLLKLETDEAKKLLSHFSFKAASHETTLHSGEKYSEYREYDNHGNITKKTVDNGEHGYVTENTYDELDRITKSVYTTKDETEITTWEYDSNGNITKKEIHLNGEPENITRTVWDEHGNKTYQFNENFKYGTTSEWTTEYNDNNAPVTSTHKISTMPDPDVYVYEYDSQGRLLKETLKRADTILSVSENVYNEDGSRTHTFISGEMTEKYVYDKDGREILSESEGVIRRETEYTEGGQLKRQIRYEFDGEGNLLLTDTTAYTLDENDRIIKKTSTLSDGTVYLYIYTYHENGKKASTECRINGERTSLALYNEDGLMIKNTTDNFDYTYEYDEHGNLLCEQDALSSFKTIRSEYKLYYSPTNFINDSTH